MESCLKKGKKGFAVLMDLEKAYDRTDGKGLCKVSRIYGMAGKLLRVFKCMYEDEKAAALVGDNLSEFFNLTVGLKQGCIVPVAVQCVLGCGHEGSTG